MGFIDYVKQKRYEIILGIIGFLLATLLIGTVAAIGQEVLKQYFLGTHLRIKPLTSASGVFTSNGGPCIRQMSSYEISANDLVKELKINVTFPDQTKIVSANAIYTVALSGFTATPLDANSIEFKLNQPLDAAKRAQVFLVTERPFRSSDQVSSQLPDIHVEGKDKNGNVVYY